MKTTTRTLHSLTLLAASPLALAFVATPSVAQAASFVTGYDTPARDSFTVCDNDSGAWNCEIVTLPAWAGFLRSEARGQQFIAIDANQDGEVGFVAFGEQALQCEPDPATAEGWSCAFLEGGTDFRRILHAELYDYDGDGIEDLTYAHYDDGPHVCYGGTFPMLCEDTNINAGAFTSALDWADFNADGIDDAFVSYSRPFQTGYSQLCLGNLAGGFDCQNFTESSNSFASTNSDAEVFDANGDGYPDLYIESTPIYGGAGEFCLNDPATPGTFNCSTADLPDIHYQGAFWGYGSTDVHTADLDGDGMDDLVMGSRGDAYVCWGDGAGTPDCQYLDGVTTFSDLDTSSEGQVSVADADGDGLLDLVRSSTAAAEAVDLCTNNGDRTFTCTPVTPNGRYHGVAFLSVGGGGPVDSDGDGVPDEDDLCPGFDDLVYAPGLDDQGGFEITIDVIDQDVALSWDALPTGSGNYEVWRSTDIDELPSISGPCTAPAGPGAEVVASGTDLDFIDVLGAATAYATPTYFYRVLTDGDEPDSAVMAKVTQATSPGYNLYGLCMVDGLEYASDAVDFFGDGVVSVHLWDGITQQWRWWWADQNSGPFGDFQLPYGGVVIMNFDATVEPYRAMVGRVPTDEIPLAAAPGHNVLSWPLVTDGYEPLASEYLPLSGFSGIEDWSADTQTSNWYYGPGDLDFTLESCGGYGFAN